jgi:large subunit ribosomal protein L28
MAHHAVAIGQVDARRTGSRHPETVPERIGGYAPEGDRLCFSAAMARICHSCGKRPAFGQSRSHSMVATKRRFDANLQKVRIIENGAPKRAYVCTRCLKAGKVTKAR